MKKHFIFILLLANITCYAQKITIALNLVKGNTYYMTVKGTLNIKQTINGQDVNVTTTITGRTSHKVTAVTDSTYAMEIKYERLAMQMSLPGKEMAFNSDKKDTSDIFSTMMAKIINKPFSIVITKAGKVKSIANVENLYAGLFEGFKVSEGQKLQFKTQMEKSFGPAAVKNNIEEAFAVFPDVKVGKDDKWVVATKIESVFTIKTNTTYTLQEIAQNTYKIHGDAVMQSDPGSDYKEMSGMPMKLVNVSGTTTADITLDKTTGWVIGSKTIKKINGTVDIKDNPKVPGGTTYPMEINGDIEITGK